MSESNGQEVKDYLPSFEFLGVDFSKTTQKMAIGSCPFCGKDKHFYLYERSTGKWDCKKCGDHGNLYSFIRKYHEWALSQTDISHYDPLEEARGIPYTEYVAHQLINYDTYWYIPIYNLKGELVGLKKWVDNLYLTPNTTQHLFGGWKLNVDGDPTTLPPIYFCEGEWDSIAFEWLRSTVGQDCVVVGTPSATMLKDEWLKLLKGRDVKLLYDNDEAGRKGRDKAIAILQGLGCTVQVLRWKGVPKQSDFSGKKIKDVNDIIAHLRKVGTSPEDIWAWFQERLKTPAKSDQAANGHDDSWSPLLPPGPKRLRPGEPPKFDQVVDELVRCGIYTFPSMIRTIAVSFATVISARMEGDPLWTFVVGPPGSGKTLALRLLEPAKEYCTFPSAFTPKAIISGYQGKDGHDYSLLGGWKKRCVVVKDFTVLMAHSQATQEAVYGIMRDAYDGRVEWGYGNQKPKIYEDCRFSFLAGVTHAIHTHSHASLGERFLKCEYLDDEHDNKAHVRAAIDMADLPIPPSLSQMVSDFVDRDIPEVHIETPEWFKRKAGALAEWVAILRTQIVRDNKNNDVLCPPQPEIGSRLGKQFTRLAQCLAAVLDQRAVTRPIWEIVRRVGVDTAYGWTRDIFTALAESHPGKVLRDTLADNLGVAEKTLARRLDNLTEVRAATRMRIPGGGYMYRASDELAALWRTIQK